MLILIGLGIVMGFLVYMSVHDSGFENFWIGVPTLICGVVLVIALIAIPINRMDEKGKIRVYHATKSTIEIARNNDEIVNSSFENAALTKEIIDINAWLANIQYWKNTCWSIWIPAEVMDLKPLK